jgi:hypothetical protein
MDSIAYVGLDVRAPVVPPSRGPERFCCSRGGVGSDGVGEERRAAAGDGVGPVRSAQEVLRL